jgi:hypothetical protein
MIFTLFSIWFLIWLASSIAFDNLLKYQYVNHKSEWNNMGSPRGMFFNPKGASYLAFYTSVFSLPRSRPSWVENDEKANYLYSKYIFWGKVIKWYALLFIPLLILATNI